VAPRREKPEAPIVEDSADRHALTLYRYMAKQKTLAGTKPHCPVRNPIKLMITLFTPATIHPCHKRRPTSSVERTVKTQEM
jgi:hypothetical protein